MRLAYRFLGIVSVVLLTLAQISFAEVPTQINYQGRLTDPMGSPRDTTVSMVFTIYDDSTGGMAKWTEEHLSVTVVDGLFNVILGTTDPIDDSVFNSPERYLGIQVGTDPELSPRSQLITVPYAFRVSTIDGASGGTIEGDVNIEGDVIITGDTVYVGSLLIQPTTRHYAIPAASFRPLYPGQSNLPASVDRTSITFHWYKGSSFTGIVVAPLQLPHGATISEAVGFFDGNWSGVELKVFRVPFVGPNPEAQLLGSQMKPSVTVYDSLIISSFADATVDNANYCYFVEFDGRGSSPGYVTFYDARITYVIDKPLP